MTSQLTDGLPVLAAMATPAVLLLANAMLVLSTNQRLQAIFQRVRETELTIAGEDVAPEIADLALLNEILLGHARRASAAHVPCSASTRPPECSSWWSSPSVWPASAPVAPSRSPSPPLSWVARCSSAGLCC